MPSAAVANGRLVVTILVVSLACAGVVGAIAHRYAAGEVAAATQERFEALREIRTTELLSYLESVREETRFWNTNRVMRAALREFSAAFAKLGPDAESELQRLYVHENPYPLGEKDNLERAEDDSEYSEIHARYHYWLRSFLLHRGVYDVFLFNPEGDLVYTSFKELDYATNLLTGRWKDTDLGGAFRAARDNPYPSFVAFFDFAPYEPSHGEPASFFSSPVLDDDGTLLGVVAFQIPSDRINDIMQATAGMGETGETYVVGPDLLMRSDSLFSEESTILKTRVDTEPARRALRAETGYLPVTPDYRGVPVLSAYGPLEFGDVRWALLSEMDDAEALAPSRRLRTLVAAAVVGSALAAGALALGFVALARGPSG